MKNKNWNLLVYVHAGLLLWALLFVISLFIPGSDNVLTVLALGNALFLFVNIPLALFSFVLKAKGYFDIQYKRPIVVLSILNIFVGIAVWYCLMLLLQKP